MSSSGLEIFAVENAIPVDAAEALLKATDNFRRGAGGSFADLRTTSVHDIPEHSPQEAASVYEPHGRVEIVDLPAGIVAELDAIFKAVLPRLHGAFPDARKNNGWFYAEYGPTQYVNPHVDYHGRIGDPKPGVLATISLTVSRAERGGEFFVEPSGDHRIWAGPHEAARGLDWSTPWFREHRRIRWTVDPLPGDVIVWGSQVIHGTTSVDEGRAGKFLTQLVTD